MRSAKALGSDQTLTRTDLPKGSINPFSTTYWEPTETEAASTPALAKKAEHGSSLMQSVFSKAARTPLQPKPNGTNETVIVGATSGTKGPIMAVSGAKAPKLAAPKLNGSELAAFKEAVDGSNLTKVDLLKALKQRFVCQREGFVLITDCHDRFPKMTNETIKDTLSSNCARIGASAAEKRWRFILT